jgi:2-methylisocitrate lyase-like PEP mutase family enzyme
MSAPRSTGAGPEHRSRAWRDLLTGERPLLLPCAHDALSARLIERAGFKAYSIGGFPLVGARHALPDVGLVGLAEMSAGMRDIMAATSLPVLVDADDGYGDVKNVTRTIETYEDMGAAAIFIEDQVAPKRCGHMAGKAVIPADAMVRKVRGGATAAGNLPRRAHRRARRPRDRRGAPARRAVSQGGGRWDIHRGAGIAR